MHLYSEIFPLLFFIITFYLIRLFPASAVKDLQHTLVSRYGSAVLYTRFGIQLFKLRQPGIFKTDIDLFVSGLIKSSGHKHL